MHCGNSTADELIPLQAQDPEAGPVASIRDKGLNFNQILTAKAQKLKPNQHQSVMNSNGPNLDPFKLGCPVLM